MEIKYARVNLKLKNDRVTNKDIERCRRLLYDQALWFELDDAEVFYLEKDKVIGISIPYYDEGLSLLEAGIKLGYCVLMRQINSLGDFEHSWHSLHEVDGTVIESTVDSITKCNTFGELHL